MSFSIVTGINGDEVIKSDLNIGANAAESLAQGISEQYGDPNVKAEKD